jgi:hypothetical protein
MSLAIYVDERIDRDPVYHDTRQWLRRSKSAIKAGYLIEGAALLQMGIRVFLEADLKYWDVRPKHRSLVEMAKAIWVAGHASRDAYAVLIEVVAYTNAVIRCEPKAGDVVGYLLNQVSIMHSFCNGTVYLNERSQS